MIWMFSQEKFLALYEEFMSNNIEMILQKLIEGLKIENFLDKEMLKDYLGSMSKIYTEINYGQSNRSNSQSQGKSQGKSQKTEDNDESKEISSDIAMNNTQIVSVDPQLHINKGNNSSSKNEFFF